MIESCYWKEDILKYARQLRKNDKPKRWSEKQAVLFEKELMIAFFCVRKLFEAHKVSSLSRKYKAEVYTTPRTKKKINLVNTHDIDDLYDFDREKETKKSILFIVNQFIHSFTIVPYRTPPEPWQGVVVCSDYESDNAIYRLRIEEIIKIFEVVGKDYPHTFKSYYDKNGKIRHETN